MFNEPCEKEVNLMPLVVHGAEKTQQNSMVRTAGFGTCGQITLCISGEGSFTDSNNHTYTIKQGDIFFVSPQASHKYTPTSNPWIVEYIVFSGCEIENIFHSLNLPQSGAVTLDDISLSNAAELISNIFTVYNSSRKSRHITASSYLYSLLILISKHAASDVRDRDSSIQRLSSAVQFINKSFDNKSLSSDLIAENAGISHPHMCRLFKAAYNMTPHDYIIHTRIEHAKYLLCGEKSMTVQAISDICGFNSSGYFIKVFKAKTGLTPMEFRIQNTYNF